MLFYLVSVCINIKHHSNFEVVFRRKNGNNQDANIGLGLGWGAETEYVTISHDVVYIIELTVSERELYLNVK